jgi:very-short-patch-repair endonuclease
LSPVERVDFELDGTIAHAAPSDRERDLRRDAELAALGILVVRFTYQRLTREPATVRREVLAILASRRS